MMAWPLVTLSEVTEATSSEDLLCNMRNGLDLDKPQSTFSSKDGSSACWPILYSVAFHRLVYIFKASGICGYGEEPGAYSGGAVNGVASASVGVLV